MAMFELPPIPEPRVSPHLLLGAASPLWSYFGAAASAGVAYWWMTRWTRPANLEALFGGRALMPDIVADTVAADLAPVGGESAPMSPLVEASVGSVADVAPAVLAETVAVPALEAAVDEEAGAQAPIPAAATASITPDGEPVDEPSAPKPRVRKAATDADA